MSLILARGLTNNFSQCFGRTVTGSDGNPLYVPCYAGVEQSTIELTATGGTTRWTNYGGGVGYRFVKWQMDAGHLVLVGWQQHHIGIGFGCNMPVGRGVPYGVSPAPYYATIGAAGPLASCNAQYLVQNSTIADSPQVFSWQVKASIQVGKVLVCLKQTSFSSSDPSAAPGVQDTCFRADQSGNIDTTKLPWVDE